MLGEALRGPGAAAPPALCWPFGGLPGLEGEPTDTGGTALTGPCSGQEPAVAPQRLSVTACPQGSRPLQQTSPLSLRSALLACPHSGPASSTFPLRAVCWGPACSQGPTWGVLLLHLPQRRALWSRLPLPAHCEPHVGPRPRGDGHGGHQETSPGSRWDWLVSTVYSNDTNGDSRRALSGVGHCF